MDMKSFPVVYGPTAIGARSFFPVEQGSRTVPHAPIGPYGGRMYYFSKRVNDGQGGWLCDASTSPTPCRWYAETSRRMRPIKVDRTGPIYQSDPALGF